MYRLLQGWNKLQPSWRHFPLSLVLIHFLLSWALVEGCIVFAPDLFEGTSDTALNFLNTIVSCVATILALCISIIMVAIQMAASKYSHRVLDLFIRCPYNISLLVVYFVTIFHCIVLMANITPSEEILTSDLNQAMSGELLLVVCCFFVLVMYSYGMIQLLKPETIIKAIDREYGICFANRKYQEAMMKVDQISDIAKKAVVDMDAVTGVLSVRVLGNMIEMADVPREDDVTLLEYHREILNQLLGVAHIAFREQENTMSEELLEILLNTGKRYARKGSLLAAGSIVELYSRIISNNLVGQHQFNFIETIVRHTYTVAYEVAKSGRPYSDIDDFVLQTFQMLNHVGKQILDMEASGTSYVARDLLSDTFGELISVIIEHAGDEVPHRVIRELMFEYMKLARLLVSKSELRDIVQITSWLRNELLPIREQKRRIQPYLYLFLLLTACSLYLKRDDIVMMLVRALGKYFTPDEQVLNQMRIGRMDIRYLFDYSNPDRYLAEAYLLWQEYHSFWKNEGAANSNGIESDVNSRNPDPMVDRTKWQELFQRESF